MAFKFLNKVKTKTVEPEEVDTTTFDEDYEQPDDEFTVDRSKLTEQEQANDTNDTLFTNREQVRAHQASAGRMTSFGGAEESLRIKDLSEIKSEEVDTSNIFEDEDVSPVVQEVKPERVVKVEPVQEEQPVVEVYEDKAYNNVISEEKNVMDDYSNVTVSTEPVESTRGIDIYNEVQPNHVVKEVSPSGLGFPEGVSVRKLNFSFLDNEPLVVTEFTDSYGELSRQIEQFEDKLHLSVLPLEVCGFRLPVSNLKGHEVVEIDGVKCASGTTRIVNGDMLNSLIRDIANTVKYNGTYTLDLEKEYKIDGKKYMLRLLNNFEVTKLLNGFRNFPIDYFEGSNGYVKIIINPRKGLVRGGQF